MNLNADTKRKLRIRAAEDVESNISMAASIYKRFEEVYDDEVASEAVNVYLTEQRRLIAVETQSLEREADLHAYQLSMEM